METQNSGSTVRFAGAGSQASSAVEIDTSKVTTVRMEELKLKTDKPVTNEADTDTGFDSMLGGSKVGKKESCWQ